MIRHEYGVADMPCWMAEVIVKNKESCHVMQLWALAARYEPTFRRWLATSRKSPEISWMEQHPFFVFLSVRLASLITNEPELLKRPDYEKAVLLAETVLAVKSK